MKRLIIALAACTATFGSITASAQSAVPITQESHLQRLTYIRNMRVFHLTLAPGESTSDFVLDHDGAILALTEATLRLHRAGAAPRDPQKVMPGRADLGQFTGEPVTQRLENVGTTPLRAIVVENLRDKGWTSPPALMAPGTTLQQESRSFAVYDMRLNSATPRTAHTHQNATFIMLMSGAVQAQGGGGESDFRMQQTGTWWFPGSGADQPHTIELAGNGDAHVICVEAK